MGGSNDPSNIISLTILEHAEAHRLLWEQHKNKQDLWAWKMLSGKTDEGEEVRILLCKEGLHKLYKTEAAILWKQKLSKSNTGRKQSAETKAKRSASLKDGYKSGKIDSWLRHADKSFFQKNYKGEVLAEGRRNSKKWKDSVTSDEYKLKKTLSDPRSKNIIINGTSYPSIRNAAKSLKIPYSRLRCLLNGKDVLTL